MEEVLNLKVGRPGELMCREMMQKLDLILILVYIYYRYLSTRDTVQWLEQLKMCVR